PCPKEDRRDANGPVWDLPLPSELLRPGAPVVGVKNQLSPANTANLTLHQTNAVQVQEASNNFDIAFAQTMPTVTECQLWERTTEDLCLKCLAFSAQIQQALKQRWVGHVSVASGIPAVLGTLGQHEMIGAANRVGGIPQAKSDAGTHYGADGERLRGGENRTRDQIVPPVLVVGSAQIMRQILHRQRGWAGAFRSSGKVHIYFSCVSVSDTVQPPGLHSSTVLRKS